MPNSIQIAARHRRRNRLTQNAATGPKQISSKGLTLTWPNMAIKAVIDSWEAKREELFQTNVRQQTRRGGMCYKCHEKRAVVICNDCTNTKNLCIFCHRMVHRGQPLHDRKAWHGGAYVSLLPTESNDKSGKIREESINGAH